MALQELLGPEIRIDIIFEFVDLKLELLHICYISLSVVFELSKLGKTL